MCFVGYHSRVEDYDWQRSLSMFSPFYMHVSCHVICGILITEHILSLVTYSRAVVI